MKRQLLAGVDEARQAALEVLRRNAHGPFRRLPRTAGWAYPEPYTRDLMIAALGVLTSGDDALVSTWRRVLTKLAANLSPHGQAPSYVHDAENRGASDTTPLFLLALGLYRTAAGEPGFLEGEARKALTWMEYQSPDDCVLVAQAPTTDWRDEQWVLGYGLYVNTLVYAYLRLFGQHERANDLRETMNQFDILAGRHHRHVHQGLRVPDKPYYALWSFKVHRNERFDLLGNSLAVLFGIPSRSRARNIISWVERECRAMRESGVLGVGAPPCLFPFVQPEDPDWRPRYEVYGLPGHYHNGGVWPFIVGFYVAAAVAAGHMRIAERNLEALTQLVRPARENDVPFGFNEWLHPADGTPRGQDWQTWSAAMYLYAAACVERGSTPLLDEIRQASYAAD